MRIKISWSITVMAAMMTTMAIAQESPPKDSSPTASDLDENEPPVLNRHQTLSSMMKQMLPATDEEWKLIQTRLEAFMNKYPRTSGKARTDENNSNNIQSEVVKCVNDLRLTLRDKSSSAATIKIKIEAVRAAKEAQKKQMAEDQRSLIQVLNARQEARLLELGIID